MKRRNLIKRKKQKLNVVFEQGVLQKNFYTKNIYSNRQRLNKLFPVSPLLITVNIFRNRTSFLRTIHKKLAPDWLVASVPPKNTSSIYVLSNEENLTEKQTISRRQVLLHEMTHLYTNTLNPNLPDWLKEGISVYIATQIFKPSISNTDWEKIAPKDVPFGHISWKFAAEHNGYNIAGLIVMFMVRRYGWTRFITAISYRESTRFSFKNTSLYFGEEFNKLMADFKKQFVK